MGAKLFGMTHETSLTIFSLETQQIEVRLVAIKSAFLSHKVYTPFHFSRTLPLKLKFESEISLFIVLLLCFMFKGQRIGQNKLFLFLIEFRLNRLYFTKE